MTSTDTAIDSLEALGDSARALRHAFERLIDPHRPALWRFSLRLTGSVWDAEDLVQDTVIKALGALPRFGQALDPRAYLFRIASNTWLDRVSARRLATPLDEVPEPAAAAVRLEDGDARRAVEHLVHVLPPRQRAIYLLTEAFDFTAKEVAAMLKTTEGAVKIALHRARRTLAEEPPAGDGRRGGGVSKEQAAVVTRYLEAFNRRDPEALAALFAPDATNVIVGDWEEQGVETMRRYSLAFWKEEPSEQQAEAGVLDGRDVVLVYGVEPDGARVLHSVIGLAVGDDGQIVAQDWYFFCPELLAHAAASLGVPARNHGYRYVPA